MLRSSAFFFLIYLLSWSCKPAEVEPPVRNKWVIKTRPLTKLGGYKAASGGTIEIRGSDSIASRGVCWTRSDQVPTINAGNDFVTDDGNSQANWVSTIAGLRPRDSIRIRAYLLTKNEGVVYGQLEGYRVPLESTLPTVVTNPVSDPRKSSALLSGSIYTDGGADIVERGFWIYNHATQGPAQLVKVPVQPNKANFDTLLRGLSSNTTYEVKAYARNAAYPNQNQIQYGQSMFFFTPANKDDAFPVVVTVKDSIYISTVGMQKDTFIVFKGNILKKGDFPIQSKGFYFKVGEDVGITDTLIASSNSLNNLEITITRNIKMFARNKQYSFRAFARNQAGLVFGEERQVYIR